MKKSLKKSLGMLSVAILTIVNSSSTYAQTAIKPVEKTSFNEVTSKLDSQGNMLLYLSANGFMEFVDDAIKQIKEGIKLSQNNNLESKEQIVKIFDMVTRILHNSGIGEVSGVGVSSIAIDKGFYRNRIILHHYKNQGKGEIWNLLGAESHNLDVVNLLPKNTALTSFSDFDFANLFEWISKEIKNSGDEKLIDNFDKFQLELKSTQNIDLKNILATINNRIGFIITLDPTKKVSIPVQQQMIQIPEPALAIVIAVKDDTLFNLIDSKCPPNMKRINDGNSKKILMQSIPIFPVPFSPSIVQQDGLLILASTSELIYDILDAKTNKTGFVKSELFNKMSKSIDLNGNAIEILTPNFSKTLADCQKQIIAKKLPNEASQLLEKYFAQTNEMSWFSVCKKTEEGFETTINSNIKAGPVLLAATTIAPLSIMAAMVLPSLGNVKDKANQAACLANLNALGKGTLLSADDRRDGSFPKSLEQLISEDYASPGLIRCKITGKQYIYNTGYTINDDSDKILIICDHGKLGGNYLVAGGSARHYKCGNKPVVSQSKNNASK